MKNDIENGGKVKDFFKFMSLCHKVVAEKNQTTGEYKYQSPSPDEEALVKASAKNEIVLTQITKETYTVDVLGDEETYKILFEFPFNSTRKRQSIVMCDPEGDYWIMTKGADSIMAPRITWKEEMGTVVDDHLLSFAKEGLRTLVMGKKPLSEEEVEQIKDDLDEIMCSDCNQDQREEKLMKMYDNYETELDYVGSSAIEDKLQDHVPETIAKLIEAEIRVWVLTGDKQETAIEIGKSCHLIQPSFEQVIINSNETRDGKPVNTRQEILKRMQDIEQSAKDQGFPLKDNIKKINLENINAVIREPLTSKKVIIVDGKTLSYILEDLEMEKLFFKIALTASSIICCRVSPAQKAQVVKLSKRYGSSWISLAIGDGANDVPMILEANIGVGIRGQEGSQAVRAADYAISQFEFLQKLILVHGRIGYRRISWVVCYYFYKNILLVFAEIYFTHFSGFSGQIYFAEWLPTLYNSLWTSATCLFAFAFEEDTHTQNMVYSNTKLFKLGQKRVYFNIGVFWKWVVFASFHGFIAFFLCSNSLTGIMDSSGKTLDHWYISSVVFSVLIHIVLLKLIIEAINANMIYIIAGLGSLMLYWIMAAGFSIPFISKILQPQLDGIYFEFLFWDWKAYCCLIFVPMIAVIPDYIWNTFWWLCFPTETQKLLLSTEVMSEKRAKAYVADEIEPLRVQIS